MKQLKLLLIVILAIAAIVLISKFVGGDEDLAQDNKGTEHNNPKKVAQINDAIASFKSKPYTTDLHTTYDVIKGDIRNAANSKLILEGFADSKIESLDLTFIEVIDGSKEKVFSDCNDKVISQMKKDLEELAVKNGSDSRVKYLQDLLSDYNNALTVVSEANKIKTNVTSLDDKFDIDKAKNLLNNSIDYHNKFGSNKFGSNELGKCKRLMNGLDRVQGVLHQKHLTFMKNQVQLFTESDFGDIKLSYFFKYHEKPLLEEIEKFKDTGLYAIPKSEVEPLINAVRAMEKNFKKEKRNEKVIVVIIICNCSDRLSIICANIRLRRKD
jgi:hypothetical protein